MKYWQQMSKKIGPAKFFVERRFFVVDQKDIKLVLKSSWSIQSGYAVGSLGTLHRLIMEAKRGEIVDHISGDTLDNRHKNLRLVSFRQNAINCSGHRISTSKHKGVYWSARYEKWCADIRRDGKKVFLGSYKIEREAVIAYNAAARVLFGKYRRRIKRENLNEIDATIYKRIKDLKAEREFNA